ncbi:Formyl-CoA:oxalate CoA-transferase [bioreactor metagenome]|uniref:Formyl-CoA:oxalate CoA-transferase n=1 Tax=bioreactor metagenome TaxID=1076179 RepID=A0A645DKI0_9ZZZZ
MLTTHRRPYQTSDGYLCVLIYNDKHWHQFYAAIGQSERMQEPMFATHTQRAAHIDAVYAEVRRLMRERTTAEWRALLDAADIPNMPMSSPEDLLADEHLNATDFVREVEHPTEGRLRTTGNPTQWSATPADPVAAHAPLLGEHTASVLKDIGINDATLADMLDSGACVQSVVRN